MSGVSFSVSNHSKFSMIHNEVKLMFVVIISVYYPQFSVERLANDPSRFHKEGKKKTRESLFYAL